MEGERKLIVDAAVKRAASLVFARAAPLLKKERHPLCPALTTNVDDPISKHRPRVRTALTADDDPVDFAQVESAEVR
jgi:hypothetical protein